MGLALNGTTGYLELAASVVTAYPCSMFIWVTTNTTGADDTWFMQGQSSADRLIRNYLKANGTDKVADVRIPGNSSGALTSYGTAGATFKPSLVVFTSATSRTVYFESGDTGTTDTASITDNLSSHDRVVVGALHFNGSAASQFHPGSVAEAHFFNTALTSGNFTTLCGDYTPESMTGWVDGWSLKDYSAGGTYASIGGSRTLTAVGGVTASGQPHPITRSAAAAPVAKSYLTLQAGKNASFY